jgi:flagellar hook-associated protein 3 FlgL
VRITNSMMLRSTMRDVGQSLSRYQQTQAKVTSGNAITTGSDDPAGTTTALSIRRELSQLDQRSRSITDAQGWVNAADSQLDIMTTRMNRAKELTVASGNAITNMTPAARQAIATELRSIRSDLLNAANSTYAGRPLFAGTAAGPAYSSTGVYQGNDDPVVRDVAPSTTMTINVTGNEVFGASGVGAGSLFEVLDRLATAIEGGNTAGIDTERANLSTAFDRVQAAASNIGTKQNALEALDTRAKNDKQTLTSRLSDVEDVDLIESIVKAKAEETSYQAAVQMAAKALPVSLLDYLR